MRVKCKDNKWNTDEKGKLITDPELTVGKFYAVVHENFQVMGADTHCTIIGDNGEEVVRPKHIFLFFKNK